MRRILESCPNLKGRRLFQSQRNDQNNARFFISNSLVSNARLKLAKNRAKAKQHPEAAPLLFENYSLSSFHVIIQKIIGDTLIVNGAEKEKYITSNGKWG